MNIYESFNNLRYHYEDEVVEFKKAENNFDFDDLAKYFSALSNEANLRDKDFGWLVFGVHDKTREILGTSYKNGMKSLQKLKYDLSQHTTDRNTFRDIYEMEVEGKRVLMFYFQRTIPTLGTKQSHVGTKSVPSRGLFASLKERMLDI